MKHFPNHSKDIPNHPMDIPNHPMDFHIHSTVSDGTDHPLEIISAIKKSGIRYFSLTDHDALEGCRMIRAALQADDIDSELHFINGIEFSCKDDEGKYHILGYGYDENYPDIQKMVDKAHGFRISKVEGRLAFLKDQYGFTFQESDLQELFALSNPGKPHIGNLMARYGYAPNKDAAITDYINKYKSPDKYLEPQEAIEAILSSGGIPVLAHPYFGSGSEKIFGKEMIYRLRRLMGMGLEGVEAFYSGFSEDLSAEMIYLASKYDLYVTAGSDYHGTNKTISLGQTGFSSETDLPEGLVRFLDRMI